MLSGMRGSFGGCEVVRRVGMFGSGWETRLVSDTLKRGGLRFVCGDAGNALRRRGVWSITAALVKDVASLVTARMLSCSRLDSMGLRRCSWCLHSVLSRGRWRSVCCPLCFYLIDVFFKHPTRQSSRESNKLLELRSQPCATKKVRVRQINQPPHFRLHFRAIIHQSE